MKFFLPLILWGLSLVSCVKTTHQERLGERRWEIGYTDIEQCSSTTPQDECDKKLRGRVLSVAKETCGAGSQPKLSRCRKDQRKGLYALVCDVECQYHRRETPKETAAPESASPHYRRRVAEMSAILSSLGVKEQLDGAAIQGISAVEDGKGTYHVITRKRKVCLEVGFADREEGVARLDSIKRINCPR